MTASSFRFGIFRPFCRSSRRRLPLALAGLAVLAGCAGEPETRPCPQAVVLNDGSRQVKFNGQGRDLTDVLFERSEEHTSELQSLLRIPYTDSCMEKKPPT